ncbi:thioesterase [halophilic archaeon]|nr:thioesterase [halophilic archaeon]
MTEDGDDLLSGIDAGFEHESTWEVGAFEPQTIADGVAVSSTPELIGCMEGTVRDGVTPLLPDGYRIVGVRIECDHRAPTPAGEEVTVSIEVEETDATDDRLVSTATVADERGTVATGRMHHAVVDRASFADRVERRFDRG